MSDESEEQQTTKKKWKLFSGLFQKLKTTKYAPYVLAVVLGLVVLAIFMSSCGKKTSSTKSDTSTQKSQNASNGVNEYSEAIEHKLENVLGSVKGCSNVRVMVVVETTPVLTLAEQIEEKTTDSGKNKTTTRSVVYEENGSIKTPMVICESAPKISGILIVAKGAGDPKTKLNIISAVQALFGVDAAKIEVLEGE